MQLRRLHAVQQQVLPLAAAYLLRAHDCRKGWPTSAVCLLGALRGRDKGLTNHDWMQEGAAGVCGVPVGGL